MPFGQCDPASSGNVPRTRSCIRRTVSSTWSASARLPKKIVSNIFPVCASRSHGRSLLCEWMAVPTKFSGATAPTVRARWP